MKINIPLIFLNFFINVKTKGTKFLKIFVQFLNIDIKLDSSQLMLVKKSKKKLNC